MDEAESKELLKKGWVHAIIPFEVAGKPKEHVEQSLDQYIENLKKDERVKVIQQDREEAIEHEDGVFSAFAECDLLIQDIETITWICLNFSPASVEIIEPDDLKVESRDLTNWFNDLLARLHSIGQDYRNQKAERDHLVMGMNQIIQNMILLSLKNSPKDQEALGKETGLAGEQIKDFLDHMVEKSKIQEKEGTYSLS